MEYRQTRHQVARGSRPDGEKGDKVFLIKNVSEMRATYQVRLLAFLASQRGMKLVIDLPRTCKIHNTLKDLIAQTGKAIQISRA